LATIKSEEFKKIWNQFMRKLQGRIIKETKRQPMSFELLEIILEDTKLCWESSYEASGRWLKNLADTDKNKADKIKYILLKDMKFHKVEQKMTWCRYLVYLLPVVMGVGGYFVSTLFNSNWIIIAASAAVPAIIMLLSARLLEKNIKANQSKKLQSEYLEQLESYCIQIENILLKD